MEKYYSKIRDEFLEPAGLINKELTFGCKIRHWHSFNPEVEWREQIGTVIENQGRWIVLAEWFSVEEYEILGHDYDLREVMQWFHTLDYALRTGGMLLPLTWDGESCLLDLSKPLKDQDLKGLYELMKEVSNNP